MAYGLGPEFGGGPLLGTLAAASTANGGSPMVRISQGNGASGDVKDPPRLVGPGAWRHGPGREQTHRRQQYRPHASSGATT